MFELKRLREKTKQNVKRRYKETRSENAWIKCDIFTPAKKI